MARNLSVALLIAAFSTYLNAQAVCISDKQFTYPQIALRAGISPSFLVRFDIVEFSPHNVRISPLDSASRPYFELFKQSVIDNLNRLVYLKDSLDFRLRLKYIIRPFTLLNSSFAELVTDDEVHFVARAPIINRIVDGVLVANPKIDSVFIETIVSYKSGKAAHQIFLSSAFLIRAGIQLEFSATIILNSKRKSIRLLNITRQAIFSRADQKRAIIS